MLSHLTKKNCRALLKKNEFSLGSIAFDHRSLLGKTHCLNISPTPECATKSIHGSNGKAQLTLKLIIILMVGVQNNLSII